MVNSASSRNPKEWNNLGKAGEPSAKQWVWERPLRKKGRKGGGGKIDLHKHFYVKGCGTFSSDTSVTRWMHRLFNNWPYTTMNICPISIVIGQSRFKILSNAKITLKIAKDFLTILPSGEISANLVTLYDT